MVTLDRGLGVPSRHLYDLVTGPSGLCGKENLEKLSEDGYQAYKTKQEFSCCFGEVGSAPPYLLWSRPGAILDVIVAIRGWTRLVCKSDGVEGTAVN